MCGKCSHLVSVLLVVIVAPTPDVSLLARRFVCGKCSHLVSVLLVVIVAPMSHCWPSLCLIVGSSLCVR